MSMDFASHKMCFGPTGKICTTCKYEPDWSEWLQITPGMKAKTGDCKMRPSSLIKELKVPLWLGDNDEIWEDGYLTILQCEYRKDKTINNKEPHGN